MHFFAQLTNIEQSHCWLHEMLRPGEYLSTYRKPNNSTIHIRWHVYLDRTFIQLRPAAGVLLVMNNNQMIFELNNIIFIKCIAHPFAVQFVWIEIKYYYFPKTQFDTCNEIYFISGSKSHYGCTLCFPCCVSNNRFVCVRHTPFGLLMCQSIQLLSEIHTHSHSHRHKTFK